MKYLKLLLALVFSSLAFNFGAEAQDKREAITRVTTTALRSSFDTLYAVSDVHGQYENFVNLLARAQLVSLDVKGFPRWKKPRSIFIVVGDLINKGPHSVANVLLMKKLQSEAFALGSRIVLLQGNHELDYLAQKTDRRHLDRLEREARKLGLGSIGPSSLFSKALEDMGLYAEIGGWIFAHSGYFAELKKKDLEDIVAAYDSRNWSLISEKATFINEHNWWQNKLSDNAKALIKMNTVGLVVGHEFDFLDIPYFIGGSPRNKIIKLDVGMHEDIAEDKRKKGRLLKCPVNAITSAHSNSMNLFSSDEKSSPCRQITPTSTELEKAIVLR